MNLSLVKIRIARSLVYVTVLITLAVMLWAAVLTAYGQTATATISGEVFLDGNINRVREPLEAGVSGTRVRLYKADGQYVAETITDETGDYVFRNLDSTYYSLHVVPPTGYIVINNGSVAISIGQVGAPLIISSSLRYGIYIPVMSR